jgi:hypothetical protein
MMKGWHAGKVENGFDDNSRQDLLRRIEPLKTKVQPLAEKITTQGHVANACGVRRPYGRSQGAGICKMIFSTPPGAQCCYCHWNKQVPACVLTQLFTLQR